MKASFLTGASKLNLKKITYSSETFDGKVGLILNGVLAPVQRNSVHRPKGTMELKPVSLDTNKFFNGPTKIDQDLSKTKLLLMS